MATISATEQFLVELINRARLDPNGEAKSLGISLNKDLSGNPIKGNAKQVLAVNDLLSDSADAHSTWMLNNDRFSHTGAGGSSPGDRMAAAGYNFTGAWSWGENIAWAGTTGTINLDDAMLTHHEGLFKSSGHRLNLMNEDFREIGVGQIRGDFTSGGTTYDTSMLTQNFAKTGSDVFLTGVAYNDSDSNEFYSIGEGRGGVSFAVGGNASLTQAAGGYTLALSASGPTAVTVTSGGFSGIVEVDFSNGNVKLDLVDDFLFLSSADTVLGAGAVGARLLGIANLDLTGNADANDLVGNSGINIIIGLDGDDWLYGMDGNDRLFGGQGSDQLIGGSGKDRLFGEDGGDVLSGEGGKDVLNGGSGHDDLYGGGGKDKLIGGLGFDTLTGGGQRDKFIFAGDFGTDTITDFSGADIIKLSRVAGAKSFSDLKHNHASQVGNDVHLDYGPNLLILADTDLSDLHSDDFIF